VCLGRAVDRLYRAKFARLGASKHQPATLIAKNHKRAVRALKTKLFSGKQIPFFRLRRVALCDVLDFGPRLGA
jgi:hypothetical protein